MLLVSLAAATSGCTGPSIPDAPSTNAEAEPTLSISELSPIDSALNPNQETVLRMTLENRGSADREVTDIQLSNTGLLEVESTSCGPVTVRASVKGSPGTYRCAWQVKAPEGSELTVSERSFSPTASVTYDSALRTQSGVPLRFRENSQLGSVESRSFSFSNGELSLSGTYDFPMPLSGAPIDMEVAVGKTGRMVETSGPEMTIDYRPEYLVSEDCPTSLDKPDVGNTRRFSCKVSSSVASTERFSPTILYKQTKTQSTTVTVQKR